MNIPSVCVKLGDAGDMYSFDLSSLRSKADPRYALAPYDPSPLAVENFREKMSDPSLVTRDDDGAVMEVERSPHGERSKSLPGGLRLGAVYLVKYRDSARARLPPAESPNRMIFSG